MKGLISMFLRLGNFTKNEDSTSRFGDFGDVSEKVEMRERMSCKSFRWYLDHVADRVPMPSLVGAGEIRQGSVCLEKNDRIDFVGQQIEAKECSNLIGTSSERPKGGFPLTAATVIRPQELCGQKSIFRPKEALRPKENCGRNILFGRNLLFRSLP